MSAESHQSGLFEAPGGAPGKPPGLPACRLVVALDLAAGGFRFEWSRTDTHEIVAHGVLTPAASNGFRWFVLDGTFVMNDRREHDGCRPMAASIHALLKRIGKRLPLAEGAVHVGILPDVDLGELKAGKLHELAIPSGMDRLTWLAGPLKDFVSALAAMPAESGLTPQQRGREALVRFVRQRAKSGPLSAPPANERPASTHRLRVTFETFDSCTLLEWTDPPHPARIATGKITCTGPDELTWELTAPGPPETFYSSHHLKAIWAALRRWLARFPVRPEDVSSRDARQLQAGARVSYLDKAPLGSDESCWYRLAQQVQVMAESMRMNFLPLGRVTPDLDPLAVDDFMRHDDRLLRREQKRAEEEKRRREIMARLTEERRRKQQAAEARHAAARKAADRQSSMRPAPEPKARPALPPVPMRLDLPELALQETAFPLADLRDYFLRERAARWWVSNQSDDLLALPYCRIQRLEYQLRTALRVLGPLRGRALLSDEVGLGKTIEAGLVLKELLTRGMVKRFLVLTVPSLVDQWEEELNDKFGLVTVTTNHASARADVAAFWREHPALVASLHTLKQPAHLEVARTVNWDLLIVDEAHYLRNRESQAWQAVNALPRQFLLLLTATPVQNSLEELYNLVTLLQPGQLPSPKEFRARFVDPKRPRQPREPEELRRLLGQVMIRNTRANAGLQLPPRRAETVVFEPAEDERTFWQGWETELRTELAQLSASQASLWGRLLLQSAGSSPSAWRHALEKFPARSTAAAWRARAPLEVSWRKKCDLLPPLTRGEGGLVVFTQFLQTQAALGEALRAAGVETFLINGATPAEQRQPMTEAFRKQGGALLLTHSGTEGRNLQFCHRLVNFDLPWNPMEIEQRIGRLHRLGQQRPVHIYNLVQAGTLQEHLLQVLQEKLNLFELVVGETGLILGERFSSDEFAEEVLRRWRDSEGRVAEALQSLGQELAEARDGYQQVKQLDETLFAKDYESL